jgi:hypothetical protein
MSAPSLILVVPLEGRPRVVVDALCEAEELRLNDWVRANEDIAALVAHALEVACDREAA